MWKIALVFGFLGYAAVASAPRAADVGPSPTAQRQVRVTLKCRPLYQQIAEMAKWGEAIAFIGQTDKGVRFILFVNAKTKSWTWMAEANGHVCPQVSGDGAVQQ